eukprot:4788388-Pleurochrysis_carterae.AAC.1
MSTHVDSIRKTVSETNPCRLVRSNDNFQKRRCREQIRKQTAVLIAIKRPPIVESYEPGSSEKPVFGTVEHVGVFTEVD